MSNHQKHNSGNNSGVSLIHRMHQSNVGNHLSGHHALADATNYQHFSNQPHSSVRFPHFNYLSRKSSAGAMGKVSLNSSTAAAVTGIKPSTASASVKRRSHISKLLLNPTTTKGSSSIKSRGLSSSHQRRGANSLARAIEKANKRRSQEAANSVSRFHQNNNEKKLILKK